MKLSLRLAHLILFSLVGLGQHAQATIAVAFFQKHKSNGELEKFGPNEPFYHTALKVPGGWLNAHPYYGVEVMPTLRSHSDVGQVAKILEINDNINVLAYQQYLGAPFDFQYQWGGSKFYCTEVIGLVLGISPRPMTCDPHYWPSNYVKYNGQVGLSPMELYRELLERGAVEKPLEE